MRGFRIITGDATGALEAMPEQSVHCCITSPPYWGLRDYGVKGQIGLESTPEEYVARLVTVFRQVRRVLRADGTLWLNLGDSYAGSWGNQGRKEERGTQRPINAPMMQNLKPYPDKRTCTGSWVNLHPTLKPKDLIGIPWRVAFALQADGWYLRSDIIWHKPNPMPESVRDRPTKAHEYIFLLAKNERYFYNANAIAEQTLGVGGGETRNRRTVWTQCTQPYTGAHFATFPERLIQPCVLAGAPIGGVVLDPFTGSGTTGVVALGLDREFIGIELNAEYVEMARGRIAGDQPLFNTEATCGKEAVA